MRKASLLFSLVLLLPAGAAQGQTLEQRVRRLEAQVDSLLRLQRSEPAITPAATPRSAPAADATAGATPPDLAGNVHVRWGFPGGGCRLVPKEFFVICHDGQRRVPEWVAYHVTREDLAENVAERSSGYTPDPDLEASERSEDVHYDHSGYDRGHMAPAADFRRSVEAMSATFLLSNMAPQRPRLNRGIWRRLEKHVRDLAQAHGSVWVITGSLFLDQIQPPLAGRVAVPSHFYKVVLCEHSTGTRELFAYILPNQVETIPSSTLGSFAVPVDSVEAVSGLNFFSALSAGEERRLEAQVRQLPRP